MSSSSDSEDLITPSELKLTAQEVIENLLPEKSKNKYNKAYEDFLQWKSEKNAHSFSENVLLSYFNEKAQKYKSSTLWSLYSMLKFILTWDEANNECNAQGAHLVIINSEAEDQVALRIFQKNSNVKQLTERPWWFYAGFRANKPDDETSRVFRTVFNETLGEVGYVNWEQGEPNNANGNEYCGVVYTKNGEFNDVDCSFELLFMCEKNIDSASS